MSTFNAHPLKPLFLPTLLLLACLVASRTMQPRYQAIITPLKTQRDSLREAKQRLSNIDPTMAATLRAKLQAERAAIALIEEGIPRIENLPGMMSRMQERAASLQLRMGDIDPLADSPLAAQATSPYAATAYAVTVRGRWAPLTQLMNDLAHQGELIVPVVESVKSDSAGTVLEARFVITLIGKSPPVIGLPLAGPTTTTPVAGAHK